MVRATLSEQEIREAIGAPGEGDLVVEGLATLDAPEDRCLHFVNADPPDAVRKALAALSGAIVILPIGSALAGELGSCRVLEAPDPRAAIARVLGLVRALDRQPPLVDAREISADARISPLALVEGSVRIGDGVEIGPFCTVGPDVSIGSGSVLHAGVRVRPRVSIGEESVIGSNSVVGGDGFGFVRDADGNLTRIPQLGGVAIGSHVEIGALTVVEVGAIATTTIEDHAKVADLALIGHGVQVGRGANVTGAVVLAGSSVIGEDVWVGMNSSVRDGRRVGARGLIGMDASVQQDLPDDAIARAPRASIASRPADDDATSVGFQTRRGS